MLLAQERVIGQYTQITQYTKPKAVLTMTNPKVITFPILKSTKNIGRQMSKLFLCFPFICFLNSIEHAKGCSHHQQNIS